MKIWNVITEALGSKERSAKVYASTLRRVHRLIYKKELEDDTLAFLKTAKTLNFVKKIVNLTQKKNAATAVIMGLKATKAPEKKIEKFRKILMASDKAYQQFLTSGKRKRPYKNAEKTWAEVIELHKKVGKEIDARNLWSVGAQTTGEEYRILMAWIYFKFISTLPPRRLEYADTRLVTKEEYEASDKSVNYVVMAPRRWKWIIHKYKTVDRYGPATLPIPGPLKAALNKIKPVVQAKNAKGFIFLTSKFRPLSRSQFSTFVKWCFKRYMGKAFTQNTVRSIKVSSVWSPTENPIKLAESMGHTVKTAVLHYI